MKILWFTWKDVTHPHAGGAEVVNEEIAKRLVKDGHEVVFIVGGYNGCTYEDYIDGYKVYRVGNRYSTYFYAYLLYRKKFVGWADLVIEEINTLPYFTKLFVKEPKALVIYQLCEKVWFYQMPFPISLIGYFLEKIYIRFLKNMFVVTISKSTKDNLCEYGFLPNNINIITMGSNSSFIGEVSLDEKFNEPTIVSLGRINSMKRTIDQIKAFELTKKIIPSLRLFIIGNVEPDYEKKFHTALERSQYKDSIYYLGRISLEKKTDILKKSHLILVTSVKEGWGLIVTEAGSQGTPAIVYNVDGLRDSVVDGVTGIICDENTPQNLSNKINLVLSDDSLYSQLSTEALSMSKKINFNACYEDFKKVLKI